MNSDLEIQLGHMCNNRCVFCVSGQQTALGEALPSEADEALARIRAGREAGARRLTILGGEPTLQPGFMDVVRGAVALGFDEIVIFTNGVKTARAAFVDEVLATGGVFSWRLSFQGGDALSHERTTRKLGSFARLLRSLEVLRARQQRVSVNLCAVSTNAASVAKLPELLLPYGVTHVHVDMVRPLDAGVRTADEMAAMLPRYTSLALPLAQMIEGFPDGFDVNVGNLPYCVAPALAPWIHHDGEPTSTIAVDGRDSLSEAWDKYAVKRRDKVKFAGCGACVFDARCNGVFDTYVSMYGGDEFVAVTRERLVALDPRQRLFTLVWSERVLALAARVALAGYASPRVVVDSGRRELVLTFVHLERRESIVVAVVPEARVGVAGGTGFALELRSFDAAADALACLRRLHEGLLASDDLRGHPPGLDAIGGALAPALERAVRRLRARIPFGGLRWTSIAADETRSAVEIVLEAPGLQSQARVRLRGRLGRVEWGYQLDGPADEDARVTLSEGLHQFVLALRGDVDAAGAARTKGSAPTLGDSAIESDSPHANRRVG